MQKKLSLDQDIYFNQYDPDYKDPYWKAAIKQIFGWKKTELEKNAIIENEILRNFRRNIWFDVTKGGAIEISVKHNSRQKASNYANGLMEEIRQMVEKESAASKELRLNYLSETLADALQEMEKAQKKLKEYALENSTLAQDNFISDSLKLDQIRMEKRKVIEIANLLSIIQNFINSGNLDDNSYEVLRSRHPLVDDIDFRRILGMSETISAWAWPDIETINAVSATLKDRIKRLDVDISNIEENAKIYATSAEDLAKYTRNAKIAEATYTVLIEQVKSQTLAAGFQPETFKVFQYATPPLFPSSPKRNVVLALGALLGLLIGFFFALMNSMRRNVYYTRSALLSAANADLALKSKPIRRLAHKSISDIKARASRRQMSMLDEAALKLIHTKVIYVINFGGQPSASNAARLLAAQSAQTGRNVILCDATSQSEKEMKQTSPQTDSTFPIQNLSEGMNWMTGAVEVPFWHLNLSATIVPLVTALIKCLYVPAMNTQLGLMALSEFSPGLVLTQVCAKPNSPTLKI